LVLAALAGVCGCARARRRESPRLPTARLSLRLRGADMASLSAADLRALGEEQVTVEDPHEHRAITLTGVRVAPLFDAALGPAWRRADDVLATCADGFRPSVPVRFFLAREAYLAYARPGSADFAVQEEPGKRTPAGPYYLVWKKAPGEDPPEPAWPYQITALDVTDFAARFAAAFPPPGADAETRDGFERFRTFCLPCHAINGSGGEVGPELNYPVNVTEYFDEPTLRAWIADPARVRFRAKMPPPLPADADQPRTIEAVVASLKAMAHAKRHPTAP
jgi:mono/diheme cytochrome c family protein